MIKLVFQLISGVASLWLAERFVPGVGLMGGIQTLVLAGVVLGALNFFIKPLLNAVTFPLRIITLGLFGIVINMAIIWILDVLLAELTITGLVPLFWTSTIFLVINLILAR